MQKIIGLFFSPIAFAVGFLWPLATQVLMRLGWVADASLALVAGAVVALFFGLGAQLRGSWIWVK